MDHQWLLEPLKEPRIQVYTILPLNYVPLRLKFRLLQLHIWLMYFFIHLQFIYCWVNHWWYKDALSQANQGQLANRTTKKTKEIKYINSKTIGWNWYLRLSPLGKGLSLGLSFLELLKILFFRWAETNY